MPTRLNKRASKIVAPAVGPSFVSLHFQENMVFGIDTYGNVWRAQAYSRSPRWFLVVAIWGRAE